MEGKDAIIVELAIGSNASVVDVERVCPLRPDKKSPKRLIIERLKVGKGFIFYRRKQ